MKKNLFLFVLMCLVVLPLFAQEAKDNTVVQTSNFVEQNSQGKIVFTSRNDGNPANWEGTAVVTRFSDGFQLSWTGKIHTPKTLYWESYKLNWVKDPHPENTPLNYYGIVGVTQTFQPPRFGFQPTPTPPGGDEYRTCFLHSIFIGCGAAAAKCGFAGPGWPACTAHRLHRHRDWRSTRFACLSTRRKRCIDIHNLRFDFPFCLHGRT